MSRSRPRTPNFARFLVTGAIIGFALGGLVALLGAPTPNYSEGTVLGYFGVIGAGLGALLAGLVAVLLDHTK